MPPLEFVKAILELIWQLLKAWWWLPLPFVLFVPLKFLWLWHVNNKYFQKWEWTILEIKIPREVDRPLKAMEQVISNFWSFYDPSDFKEKWFEGKYLMSIALEIASIDGVVHFYLRIPTAHRKVFESAVYSQYPEVEIEEVEDYTKKVPQNIPNKDWDMWACNFKLERPDPYPIKTYFSFFEPTQEVAEERRIDPLAVLIEGMSRLKPDEQLWLQVIAKPVKPVDNDWVSEGRQIVNKYVRRPEPPKEKSIVGEAWRTLTTGKEPFTEEAKEESVIPAEMRLTPGEREIVSAIENKIAKKGFESQVRMIYLGKGDAFFKPNLRMIFNFSSGVSTENLNTLKPTMTTKVVPPAPFREKRLYLKKRVLFRRYVTRQVYPHYPKIHGTYVLNEEEIATLFHFPGRMGAPTPAFPRIEAKKGGAPPEIPTE